MREQIYQTIFYLCCCIIGTRSQEDSCVNMQHKELLTSTNHYITGEIQALVPTMRFNCSGKITSWKMAILQQNFELSVEPIKLQVWRYIGDGVYRLIGSNSIPYDQTEMPTIVTHNVSTNNQISFTAGDVIGFFITNSNYRLLLDSTNASSDIIYIPSVTGRQLCTFNTTCDQIIRMKKNFMPQLNIIYEVGVDSADNNSTETCTEWSEIYNNCEARPLTTVETSGSDQRPTETSGNTSDRTSVTNTADNGTSKDPIALIVGSIIGGTIFVFILIIITLTAIVCLRKRHLRKRSNHLINGPPVLELKSLFPDYYKPYQNYPPVTNCYSSEERIINHLVNGTKLNNEKKKNSFQEDDYIVMASYLASSTDTYEKMTKIAPPVIEEKHEKIPEIYEKTEETTKETVKETKETVKETKAVEKEIKVEEGDEDKTMSEAIASWMDSTQIVRIPKQNIKFLTQVKTSVNTVVYKGILDLTEEGKQEVAVRQLKRGISKADTIRFMQEIAILTQIHHPSIVRFYGMIENENPRMAVVELGSHGNLEEFLKEQSEITRQHKSISAELHELFKTFSRQIATGMNYAHNKEYAHGNLETKHIIITSHNQCKITGLSVICSACPRDMMSYLPSSSKMLLPPPEVAEDGRFMKESDIWSFGTILYLMWGTGHNPRETLATAYNEMLYSGNSTNKNVIPIIPNGLPIINNIVKECWKLNPIKRPSFSSLVTWIAELDCDYTDV